MDVVSLVNGSARGRITDHGAQVLSWAPQGQDDALWVSRFAVFAEGVAIRGGIPICFPWFGAGRSGDLEPAHGFARITDWTLESVDEGKDATTVVHVLRGHGTARAHFPFDHRVTSTARFGEELKVSVEVVNCGSVAFTCEIALHAYLAVGDVTAIRIEGLEGTSYVDKVLGVESKQFGDVVIDREVDRVYATSGAARLVDPVMDRTITIGKSGSGSTVIWNPWEAKSRALGDFGDDEWRSMVCIETGAIGASAITLEPQGSHVISTVMAIEGR